jgi:outer membrane protein assembly factor BamB
LHAIDASTGLKLWSFTTAGRVDSSPAVANGVVYVGWDNGKLYALDATTGHKLWSHTTGDPVGSSPAVVNGEVYVGSSDQKVYAFDLAANRPKVAP